MILLSVTILILDIFSYDLEFHTKTLIICLFAFYNMILFFDVLLIIYTSYLLFKRSRSLESEEEEEKFKYEKKWFWMHASTFVLMMIIFPFEIFSWRESIYISTKCSIIVDCIKLYTAINFCIIFVLRKSVQEKLKNQYFIIKNLLFVRD